MKLFKLSLFILFTFVSSYVLKAENDSLEKQYLVLKHIKNNQQEILERGDEVVIHLKNNQQSKGIIHSFNDSTIFLYDDALLFKDIRFIKLKSHTQKDEKKGGYRAIVIGTALIGTISGLSYYLYHHVNDDFYALLIYVASLDALYYAVQYTIAGIAVVLLPYTYFNIEKRWEIVY
ncbi:MAG: hypothetical protein HN600_00640 [Bacteroidetes bacterium]|nr:hypothetical protein [Bacteroidota bacterium]